MCPVTGYLVHPPPGMQTHYQWCRSKLELDFLKRGKRKRNNLRRRRRPEEVMNMIGENLSQKETQFGYMLLLLIASGWKCHELPMYHSSLVMMPHLRARRQYRYQYTWQQHYIENWQISRINFSKCFVIKFNKIRFRSSLPLKY